MAKINITTMCLIASNRTDIPLQLEYESCCPTSSPNGTNIWDYRRDCGATCYTKDEKLANDFYGCVKNVTQSLGRDVNATSDLILGGCENIDYKSVEKVEKAKKGGAAAVSAGVWGRMAVLGAVGVLVFASV